MKNITLKNIPVKKKKQKKSKNKSSLEKNWAKKRVHVKKNQHAPLTLNQIITQLDLPKPIFVLQCMKNITLKNIPVNSNFQKKYSFEDSLNASVLACEKKNRKFQKRRIIDAKLRFNRKKHLSSIKRKYGKISKEPPFSMEKVLYSLQGDIFSQKDLHVLTQGFLHWAVFDVQGRFATLNTTRDVFDKVHEDLKIELMCRFINKKNSKERYHFQNKINKELSKAKFSTKKRDHNYNNMHKLKGMTFMQGYRGIYLTYRNRNTSAHLRTLLAQYLAFLGACIDASYDSDLLNEWSKKLSHENKPLSKKIISILMRHFRKSKILHTIMSIFSDYDLSETKLKARIQCIINTVVDKLGITNAKSMINIKIMRKMDDSIYYYLNYSNIYNKNKKYALKVKVFLIAKLTDMINGLHENIFKIENVKYEREYLE